MNTWAIISLIGLVAVIVIANKCHINIGIVGYSAALVLGLLGGMKLKEIYGAFPTAIFLRMLGMQVFLVIARENGTLKILGNALFAVIKGKAVRALPIILVAVLGLGSWFNLGISGVLQPLIMTMAYEMGFKDPLTLAFVVMIPTIGFSYSAFSASGLDMIGWAEQYGVTYDPWAHAFHQVVPGLIFFFILYFHYGWHKLDTSTIKRPEEGTTGDKFGRNQILTLCGFACYIIGNMVFKLDMMITPVVVGVLLMILGATDPVKCFKSIPWGSLMMIAGMSIYVGIIKSMGGVDLIVEAFKMVANATTGAGWMCLICGIMSIFSSHNSVVVPTMTAVVNELVTAIPGLDAQTLYFALGVGGYSTAISPMSTIGANTQAYYSAVYNPTQDEQQKVFNDQLKCALLAMAIHTIFAFAGWYGLKF